MDTTDTLTFENRDEFSRKQVAEKVISLLQADIEISPMVIDGGWGTGKTEFCHKLINMMRDDNSQHLIYINAFKADHADEPLMTVLAEVIKILPDETTKTNFIKKVVPAARFCLKSGLKAGVAHLLRQDFAEVADDFDEEIQETADKAIDATVSSLLNDHVDAEKDLKALQTALLGIAEDKPIILFIDKLDRCKPNFAVDMLEVIKHTFDVPNVKFVLITNTQQIKASINHCYGNSVEAQRYLDKFVKFTFKLPDSHSKNAHHQTKVSATHYVNLINKSSVLANTEITNERESYLNFAKHIIQRHNVSLREIETIVRYLEIYHTLTNNKGLASNVIYGFKMLRLSAVFLLTINSKLAFEIFEKRANADHIGKFFGEQSANLPGQKAYSEDYQILAVILGQECLINSKNYTPSEESKSYWVETINSYFGGSFRVPEYGERSNILIETIKTLNLNTV